ncbi:hypothetical protein L1887_35519 [Cichorium endivia]|nr:hypothetical protein L1887_35519 [Cichorium endivia]
MKGSGGQLFIWIMRKGGYIDGNRRTWTSSSLRLHLQFGDSVIGGQSSTKKVGGILSLRMAEKGDISIVVMSCNNSSLSEVQKHNLERELRRDSASGV